VVLNLGGVEELLFDKGTNTKVSLFSNQVVTKGEAGAKVVNDKVVVGAVVSVEFVSKVD
jgi:hypothetical protein